MVGEIGGEWKGQGPLDVRRKAVTNAYGATDPVAFIVQVGRLRRRGQSLARSLSPGVDIRSYWFKASHHSRRS